MKIHLDFNFLEPESLDKFLNCERLHVICSKTFLNAQLPDNDLADYCADISTGVDDWAVESHRDGSHCINTQPVDQGDPTCTVAAQYSWGKRFEAEFTIRRWRKDCNDPVTGPTGKKTAMLTEVCDIVYGDYSAHGTAKELKSVHCGNN